MLPKAQVKPALLKLFKKRPVVTIDDLYACLETQSRMTCFRQLRDLGYQSSYSHSGKYYTLTTIPHFDAYGLWHHEGIGFSRSGNLKNTISGLVESSFGGFTNKRLEKFLLIPANNTLLDLVRHGRIQRKRSGSSFVYLSADNDTAAEQFVFFQKQRLPPTQGPLPDWTLVTVLAAVIRCGDFIPKPELVFNDLQAQGQSISLDDIEQVFEQCNFKKNL